MKKQLFIPLALLLLLLCLPALAECAPGENKTARRTELEPTCEKFGRVVIYCTECGKELDVQNLPPTGHKPHDTVTEQPTCQKDGNKRTDCSVCGAFLYNTTLFKTAHSYGEYVQVRAPGCTEEGLEERACVWCGSKDRRAVPAGHDYGAWAPIAAPSCAVSGKEGRVCSRCNYTQTRSVPALGHDLPAAWTETKAPTCTEKGEKTRACARPGCTYTEKKTLKALGHDLPAAWTETKAPTCTEKGEKARACARPGCTYTETKTLKALGHQMEKNWRTLTPAACDAAGEAERACTRAGCVYTEKKTLPALKHKNAKWKVTVASTITTGGHRELVCPDCGLTVRSEDTSPTRLKNNTVCAEGIRLRDAGISDQWYMYTPVDLSRNGSLTLELVASNLFYVGTVNLLVQDGTVTVSYFIPGGAAEVTLPFYTLVPDIAALPSFEPEELAAEYALPLDTPLPLEEYFPGQETLDFFFCCKLDYTYDARLMTRLK